MGKNKKSLGESIDIIYEATEHAKITWVLQKDNGTNARFVQYVLTIWLNYLGSLIEIFDT